MPVMHFEVEWPDGTSEECYSPSSVITQYLISGATYSLEAFVALSETALIAASERVREKYGFSCSSAMDQLNKIHCKASDFKDENDAKILIKRIFQP